MGKIHNVKLFFQLVWTYQGTINRIKIIFLSPQKNLQRSIKQTCGSGMMRNLLRVSKIMNKRKFRNMNLARYNIVNRRKRNEKLILYNLHKNHLQQINNVYCFCHEMISTAVWPPWCALFTFFSRNNVTEFLDRHCTFQNYET